VGRYGRIVIIIAIIVALAGAILGFQKISLSEFERGGDTPLGLSLGLDLQGGGHLVYQANLTDPETGAVLEVSEDQMESLKRAIERRVNSAGLGEPIIQILGADRLLVQLPGVSDLQRAKDLIGETARLEFKRRELNVPREADEISTDDVLSVTVDFLPEPDLGEDEPAETETESEDEQTADTESEDEQTADTESEDEQTADTESEDAESGQPAAPDVPAEAEEPLDRPIAFLVEFTNAGALEFQAILDRVTGKYIEAVTQLQIGERGYPSFIEVLVDGSQQLRYQITPLAIAQMETSTTYAFLVPEEVTTNEQPPLEVMKERVGDSAQIRFIELQGSVDEDTGLTGDDLSRAFPGQHTASGLPIVNLEFDDRGTRIFGELTQDIIVKQQDTGIRDQIAIFLDGNELISPEVNAVITSGTAIIEGRQDFTIERVRNLALLLESGRLPIPIELIQERGVDAILGADSLAKSVVAGLIGLALVLVFMVLYYRLPGLVAAVALLIYVSIVLAIFKIVPVTLTLSGVAAVILSIGMAVDANILIFERMKEELRAGRTLLSSINFGFDRAWPAIRDGNVSTLITCAILFWFADQLGASIVQGFAVSLAIGVGASMFTAITVSRTLLRVVATARFTRNIRVWLPSGGSEVPQQNLTDAAD
jgi:protein-export membrane protein SecD